MHNRMYHASRCDHSQYTALFRQACGDESMAPNETRTALVRQDKRQCTQLTICDVKCDCLSMDSSHLLSLLRLRLCALCNVKFLMASTALYTTTLQKKRYYIIGTRSMGHIS